MEQTPVALLKAQPDIDTTEVLAISKVKPHVQQQRALLP